RDARQHELLARRRDQLGGVGDAIGLGDEPARDRVAVDAPGNIVVHGRILPSPGKGGGWRGSPRRRGKAPVEASRFPDHDLKSARGGRVAFPLPQRETLTPPPY